MEIFREDIIYGQEENIVKKIVSLLETAALFFMAFPMTAWAAEGSAESISPAFCIPFAGLLLCVAVLPLIKAEWWESHQLHAVIFWSLLFIVPFAFLRKLQQFQLTLVVILQIHYFVLLIQ